MKQMITSLFAILLISFYTTVSAQENSVASIDSKPAEATIAGNTKPDTSAAAPSAKNKIAVIPMSYVNNSWNESTQEMGYHFQELTISYLGKSAKQLNVIGAAEVNASLLKKGITGENIRKFTPKELADMLHVEYVIIGSVLQANENTVTVNSGNSSRNTNYQQNHHNTKNVFYNSSSTTQHIRTKVVLTIYNDNGHSIYSKARRSILSEGDAYENTLKYLLKRSPLHKK